MAESRSITTAEIVAKTRIAEHADFLAEAVAMVAARVMEAEIGAARDEISHEGATHRPIEAATGQGCGRPGSVRSTWRCRASEVEPPNFLL
jgi:hypothetical protein